MDKRCVREAAVWRLCRPDGVAPHNGERSADPTYDADVRAFVFRTAAGASHAATRTTWRSRAHLTTMRLI